MKSLNFILMIVCLPSLVFAQIPKEAFKMKIVADNLEFVPAVGHHFNGKAPNKVEFKIQDKLEKSEKLDFANDKIKVKNTKDKPLGCEIHAQLYVCDEKETYCVPRKQKYKCSGEILSLGSGFESTAASEIKKEGLFYLNNPKPAFDEAVKNNKLILIDFFGIWCPPCNMLDETIFNTNLFKNYSKDYVFLKMDADKAESWELKSKYKVTGYPTVIIAKPGGDEILRIIGVRKPKAFLKEMSNAVAWKNLNQDEIKKLNVAKVIPQIAALEKALEKDDHEKSVLLTKEILSKPAILEEAEWTKADLYSVLGNAYEELKNDQASKENYKKAFDEFSQLIKAAGLNEQTERGYNLERIICLWKSGDFKLAKKYYERLEKKYPDEFTFYYQHAYMLRQMKSPEQALAKALQAFEHSYGDNKLRVTSMIAELQIELGRKKEALEMLNKVISSTELPEDKTIRTHRYFDKLIKLKEKLT